MVRASVNPLPNVVSLFRQMIGCIFFGGYLSVKEPQVLGKKKEYTPLGNGSTGAHRTRLLKFKTYL